jgi:hypothetical protein
MNLGRAVVGVTGAGEAGVDDYRKAVEIYERRGKEFIPS